MDLTFRQIWPRLRTPHSVHRPPVFGLRRITSPVLIRLLGKDSPVPGPREFPIKPTRPLAARRTLHHVGCRTPAPVQAEFATPPLGRGDLSIAQCGDSYGSLRGSAGGRAATVCIFCTKLLRSQETAKWVSSKIPQTAVGRLFLLSAPCVRTAMSLRSNRAGKLGPREAGVRESAGESRQGVADERAVWRRSSEPLQPRVMRRLW